MDIGAALGCGAHLSALRRTGIGPFTVAEAVSLAQLEAAEPAARDRLLAPVDALVRHLDALEFGADEAAALLQGRMLRSLATGCAGTLVRAYGPQGFLGLAAWQADGRLVPRRLIATGAQAAG
jgi:tRNA pseudouridine55 synthase